MTQPSEALASSGRARSDPASADLLGVLEQRLERLVDRYREGRRTVQELRGLLKERDKRIGELNDKVYALARLRTDARKHVDRLLGELERLERQDGRGRARSGKG